MTRTRPDTERNTTRLQDINTSHSPSSFTLSDVLFDALSRHSHSPMRL